MKKKKALISILLVVFSALMVTTSSFGMFFPWFNASIFIVLLMFSILAIFQRTESPAFYIILLCIFSASVKLFMFTDVSGVIGIDPWKYGRFSQLIIETGSVNEISSGFYSRAPLFPIFAGIFGIVGGESGLGSLVIHVLSFSLVIPLFVSLIGSVLSENPSLPVFLAVLAVGSDLITKFTYWPIAQIMSFIYGLMVVYLLLRWPSKLPKKAKLIGGLSIVGISYSHRLLLPVLVLFLGVLIVWRLVFDSEIEERLQFRSTISFFFILVCIFLAIQYTFVTDYIRVLAAQLVLLMEPILNGESLISQISSIIAREPIESGPIAATPPSDRLFGLLSGQATGVFAVILVSSIAWTATLIQYHKYRDSKDVILILTAVFTGLTVVSFYKPEVGTSRLLVLIAAFSLPIIGYFLICLLRSISIGKPIAVMLTIFLLVNMAFSAATVPDYPNTAREYLHEQELEAGEFTVEYASTKAGTDGYFAYVASARGQEMIEDSTNQLINGNLPTNDLYIHRDIDIIWAPTSQWVLSWDPRSVADSKRHKVYTSNETIIFSKIQ